MDIKEKERLLEYAKTIGSKWHCFKHQEPVSDVKGLGDVVAKMTSAIGIKPCNGCKKRQEWLNKLVKFR